MRLVRLLRATATPIHFRSTRKVPFVQCRLSRGERVTGEVRARQRRKNMTKHDRKKRMETGPDSAGQGGATQQISDTPIADSESVEELAEEGNAFEANVIYGVENASDPDVAEVTTHEIPEDDVPGEYLDNDDHLA